MFDAFVLAAGLGTRLRPLTLHRPKPLVPVGGVPMLDYALAHARAHGAHRVLVNAHHLAEQVVAWGAGHEGVEVVVEHDILGTGGGLAAQAMRLATPCVVLNADVLTDVDLTALRRGAPRGGAALALRRSEQAERYGIVAIDGEGVIARLARVAETPPVGPISLDTHFTGLHALDPGLLGRVPKRGEACIVRTAYRDLVPLRNLRGIVHDGLWLDVGDPAAYLEANLAVLRGTLPTALDPWTRAVAGSPSVGRFGDLPDAVGDGVWWGHGATLGEGARVTHAVVGAGARLAPGAVLHRVVVWDGAEVPAGNWTDGVWHDGGFLRVGDPR
jgi:mannose-1-phosphate guanylyltransferase